MQAEIKLDLAAIAGVEQAARDAALETVGALRGEVITAQVMPFDQGELQNKKTSVVQEPKENEIHTMLTTDGPYARRLFNHPEYNFQKGNNPNAQAEWLKPWLAGGAQADFVQKTFASRLKGRLEP